MNWILILSHIRTSQVFSEVAEALADAQLQIETLIPGIYLVGGGPRRLDVGSIAPRLLSRIETSWHVSKYESAITNHPEWSRMISSAKSRAGFPSPVDRYILFTDGDSTRLSQILEDRRIGFRAVADGAFLIAPINDGQASDFSEFIAEALGGPGMPRYAVMRLYGGKSNYPVWGTPVLLQARSA